MIDLSEFFSIQTGLLSRLPRDHSRFLKTAIRWSNKLLGITGARGTGKTTILLQHLNEQSGNTQRHLYISADHIRVHATGLYEIAAGFFRLGGELIMIDEIHKYENWQRVVKNLYDAFPAGKIFFSGSSTLALQKGKADLSRRAVFYVLPGLSFREYLYFSGGPEFKPVRLQDLLQNHAAIASDFLKEGPILGHFRDYLDHGVYPFFLEGIEEYSRKLTNILEKVLYEDIPTAIGIKMANVPILKKILWLIATSQPFSPNIERMSSNLRISKAYVYTYLEALERAGLLSGLLPSVSGYRLVRKPSKIYLENTNLLKTVVGSIGGKGEEGTVGETFFAQQMRGAELQVRVPPQGDFLVEGKYLCEIGGRRKDKRRFEPSESIFIVKDDIEVGFENIIPLWLFGFLY